MPQTPPLPELVREIAEESLGLASELEGAHAIQWSAAPVPKPHDDTTERAKGGHGDPVPSIVTDPRRLAVRAAVVDAEIELAKMIAAVREARATVREAVARWQGV